jgi:tetratricopeptide (TPR) repeat protein
MKQALIFCCLLLSFALSAQTSTDQQLANLYYNNGEFDKALPYFEKIINKQSTKFDQLRYVDCLEKTNQVKDAEKFLKKLVSSNPADFDYTIALGDLFERTERVSQTEKLYNDRIKQTASNGYEVVELYNSFIKKGKVDWGLKTLEAGRKELKKNYPLQIQFAEVYSLLGRTDEMIDEYFDILDQYPNYSSNIQNALTRQIDFSEDKTGVYQKLKDKLLVRIQKKPNDFIYSEMLIWLFIQKKEFKSALTQTQALDRREKGTGNRVMDLAETCVENSDYATARLAYKYVIDQGSQNPNYYSAYSSLLNIRYREITIEKKFQPQDIVDAEREYREGLKLLGWGRNAVYTAKELAEIKAYYGNDAKGAADLLDSCLAVNGLSDFEKSQVKMALADVLVLQDDIWQASLYYMQIDKDFKFEAIGSEAKFKNARIFYYDGDFKFAQSQLDVLKESTSKLIANDAMKLSVLITDNLGLDSNYTAMYQFAQADLFLEQHQYDRAFKLYDSINQAFPAHGLADEILLRKAQAMQYQGKWQEALDYLDKIVKYHMDDILADDAIFTIAEIYEKNLHDKEKATEYYKKILFECKGSLLTVEARKRYRALRGDVSDSEDL